VKEEIVEPAIHLLEAGLPEANERPKIAIASASLHLVGDYAHAVYKAGGEPVVVPRDNQGLATLSRCDGLLLTGVGATDCDVPQKFWTDTPHDDHRWETGEELAALDWCEWLLGVCIWAKRRRIPTIGAGLGAQLLVVEAGGKLLPHVPGHENNDPYRPGGTVQHIVFEPGSWLTAAWAMATEENGRTPMEVSQSEIPTSAEVICSHHQAPSPEELPPSVRVVAWTNDEVPDPDDEERLITIKVPHAWELLGPDNLPWGFGLQFEPQHSQDPEGWGNYLLKWFIKHQCK
jgi:gamma-glutamyl-gamma-aminobutyrate hydrolase PuuD